MMIKTGTTAPNFTLPCVHGPTYRLKQFRGNRHVILAFLPSFATELNQTQMQLYQELNKHVADFRAVLLGICTDPACLGDDFIKGLSYPILADSNPPGRVGKKYRVYDKANERMFRALVIINSQGKVVLSYRAAEEKIIGADMIFTTLASLKI